MIAGRLRDRLTIQKSATVGDGYGEHTETWQTYATIWGRYEALRGREYWDAQQTNSEITGKVETRYLEGITPKMRIQFEGRTLRIIAVTDPGEAHRELLIFVREEAA